MAKRTSIRVRDARRRDFGGRLRELRYERGLSQEELADVAGVHRNYVGSVERGERNIGLDNIHALATALDVDVSELFCPMGLARKPR